METLKNIKLGGLAVALGLGLVFTQSAFKPEKSLNNVYGYDYTNSQWTLEGTANYQCVAPIDDPCKYDFGTGAPALGETPANTSATPVPDEFGSYEEVL